MSENQPFQHMRLRLVRDAILRPDPPKIPKDPKTQELLTTGRSRHASSLYESAQAIVSHWNKVARERQQDNLPEIPEALSLFLQIDPHHLPIEKLRLFGIEVISELEDGFIVGASSDIHLVTLQEKIAQFARGRQHNVAGLWSIMGGQSWKIERILSDSLREEWGNIRDDEVFVVDVGIACLGTFELPEHPKNRIRQYETKEAYEKAVQNFERKCLELYDYWDENANVRYDQLMKIVRAYGGEDLSGMVNEPFDYRVSLPDSFTVRIKINGKGLRDIVYNFPYVFDVTEAEQLVQPEEAREPDAPFEEKTVTVLPPTEASPAVCIIDSGIQERHKLLRPAVDGAASHSWVGTATETADGVPSGGHGTRVAGAVLYPREIPKTGTVQPICWLQNARVLEGNRQMPSSLFPPKLLHEIVQYYHMGHRKTRIFNHSINSIYPCRTVHMSAWAAAIDSLSWEYDVLFVVSAGNIPPINKHPSTFRPSITEHLQNGRGYPDYLLEPSGRIANPAQSLQAITVGSVGLAQLDHDGVKSFSVYQRPSSFSCTGPGIFGSIKPEVVEFGGCFAYDANHPPGILTKPELSPELVCSTLHGGQAVRRDQVGTSFAAPKVAHILAHIQREFPDESTLLYRALLVHSARWPGWADQEADKYKVVRHIGYGLPDLDRAIRNTPYRITFITHGEVRIAGKQVHIYEIMIPYELRRPGNHFDIRIDVTLSYKAQPRRTRRNRRRYLSTWLEWETSRRNESFDAFLSRMVLLANADELRRADEKGDTISWTIGKQGNHGKVRGISRNDSTIQKDWAYIKSYEWDQGFYIAVIGHMGWNTDMNATVPYALAVSFEAVNEDIAIYAPIRIMNEVEIKY
jgi:hypothetical protein